MATTNDAMYTALKALYPTAGDTLGDLLYTHWSTVGLQYRGSLQFDYYVAQGELHLDVKWQTDLRLRSRSDGRCPDNIHRPLVPRQGASLRFRAFIRGGLHRISSRLVLGSNPGALRQLA